MDFFIILQPSQCRNVTYVVHQRIDWYLLAFRNTCNKIIHTCFYERNYLLVLQIIQNLLLCFVIVGILPVLCSGRDNRTSADMVVTHCPGALLVSILMGNKTWRTRNAVRYSNGDCGKTMQHFAMMSASDFFVWYMRSSMGSWFLLPLLRLAEKRAINLAMLHIISPVCYS